MGDFLSPKRKDVVERLRRRIDLYRRHNNGRLTAFEPTINGLYDHTRQDTILLHQRWLENRAKKASKHKKGDHSSGQGEQRSGAQNRGKRKPESNVDATAPADIGLGHEPGSPQNKKPCTTGLGGTSDGANTIPSLSVQIVQQINPKHEQSQTIETNVTVKSTISGSNQSTHAESSISTNIECKREPLDDLHCNASSASSHTSDSLTNILDVDELQAILDTLEKEEGEIPPEIIQEIDKFTENIPKEAEDLDIKDASLFGTATTTQGKSSPKMQTGPFMDPSSQNPAVAQSGVNSIFDAPTVSSVSTNMTGMNAPLPSYRPMTHQMNAGPPPPVLESTGPAAETLKQMAAQHQQQQQGGAYPVQKSSPYGDPFGRNGSYPGYQNSYNNQENQYYNQIPPRMPNEVEGFRQPIPMGHAQSGMGKQGSLSYDTTKPLSHFPEPMSGQAASSMPSSLQQLQNQVHSHFNRGGGQPTMMQAPPHMQISQSQQMQLSAPGVQRLQMSQSQHMHINGQAQQISVAQQQSFSMSQGMPRQPGQQQFMSEQMKMQLMREKMQRSSSQDHVMMAQQQQYMNQPPPDYKMSVASQNYAGMGHGSNPLQTMQNMVNQTSQPVQPDMFPNVKTELGQTPPGQMFTNVKTELGQTPPVQMGMNQVGQMQSGSMPTSNPMVPPRGGSGPQSALQRTQIYQNQMKMANQNSQSSAQNRPGKSSTPVFTSAIMRGQRPPNVNVGPEGLNISQPRTQTPDWQKMHQMQQNQRLQQSQQHLPNTPAPPYSSYHGTPTSSAQVQLQQQVMQQSMVSGNRSIPQNQTEFMLQMRQQQQIRVQQRQQQSNQSQSFSPSMTPTSHSQSPFATSNSTPNANEFPLDFLDNAQNSSADFFDAAPSDFNLIEELLGGK